MLISAGAAVGSDVFPAANDEAVPGMFGEDTGMQEGGKVVDITGDILVATQRTSLDSRLVAWFIMLRFSDTDS